MTFNAKKSLGPHSAKYLILIGIVLLVALIWVVWLRKHQQSLTNFETIKRGSILNSVYGIGTLTATRSFSIKIGVTSTLYKIFVEEGQVVKKGDRLVDLEGFGHYKAPFAGTVVSAPFKEGETVYAQTVVLALVDPTDTYLLVSLEQQGALSLAPGLPAKISFDGLRDKVFGGKVESVYSNGTDFFARLSVQSLPKSILPGMTADVAIILNEKNDALLLPISSLQEKIAVISRNGKTLRVPVKVGLVDGAYAEILSGDVEVGDHAVQLKRVVK